MFEKSKFNQSINVWDVSNVSSFYGLFHSSNFNKSVDFLFFKGKKKNIYLKYYELFNSDSSFETKTFYGKYEWNISKKLEKYFCVILIIFFIVDLMICLKKKYEIKNLISPFIIDSIFFLIIFYYNKNIKTLHNISIIFNDSFKYGAIRKIDKFYLNFPTMIVLFFISHFVLFIFFNISLLFIFYKLFLILLDSFLGTALNPRGEF